MRPWITAALTALSALTLAEGTTLGTKPDLTVSASNQAPSGPVVGGMEIAQLLVVLGAIFLLLKFGLPKLIAKFGKRISTPFDSAIQLHETANFGGGNLQVVQVRGKTLLLAVTHTGVSCLADLTDAPAHKDTEPAFFELFDKAKQTEDPETLKARAVVHLQEDEAPATKSQHKQSPKQNPKVKAYTNPTDQPQESMSDEELSKDLQARLKRLSQLVN